MTALALPASKQGSTYSACAYAYHSSRLAYSVGAQAPGVFVPSSPSQTAPPTPPFIDLAGLRTHLPPLSSSPTPRPEHQGYSGDYLSSEWPALKTPELVSAIPSPQHTPSYFPSFRPVSPFATRNSSFLRPPPLSRSPSSSPTRSRSPFSWSPSSPSSLIHPSPLPFLRPTEQSAGVVPVSSGFYSFSFESSSVAASGKGAGMTPALTIVTSLPVPASLDLVDDLDLEDEDPFRQAVMNMRGGDDFDGDMEEWEDGDDSPSEDMAWEGQLAKV
ncbi:hypothetical protein JCM11641_002516 [Rhodosporidiobolus odoratus]